MVVIEVGLIFTKILNYSPVYCNHGSAEPKRTCRSVQQDARLDELPFISIMGRSIIMLLVSNNIF